jgi:hypothetical protein
MAFSLVLSVFCVLQDLKFHPTFVVYLAATIGALLSFYAKMASAQEKNLMCIVTGI